MAKIRIFNVSGRILKSDTRSGPVRIQVGGTLDLNSHMDIGPLMKEQLDTKLLKLRTLDQLPATAPPTAKPKRGSKKKTSKRTAPDPPVEPTVEPAPKKEPPRYDGLTGDKLVLAVMKDMIAEGDNLGRDGKPNQPVLELRVQAINHNMTISAKRRDRLLAKV